MKAIGSLLLFLSMVPASALAMTELDPVDTSPNIPSGIVVRVAQDGSREVFKGGVSRVAMQDVQMAQQETQSILVPQNKIEKITPLSELDRTSSKDSWCWGGYYQDVYYYYSPWYPTSVVYYEYAPLWGYPCVGGICYYYSVVH